MVVVEVVEEFTGMEALPAYPDQVEFWLDILDPHFLRQAFEDGEQLPEYLA